MLSSKKIILSSVLLSASFLTISSTTPAFFCCCGDSSASEESGRTPIRTNQRTAPTRGGTDADTSVAAAAAARTPTSTSDTSAGEQRQPLLASAAVSTSAPISSELVALGTGASLGLTLRSRPTVVNNHTIQESEEGVKIVTTPTGAVVFVFPKAYIAFQAYDSTDQLSLPTSRMVTNDQSILQEIPADVRRLFVQQTRDAFREKKLGLLTTKLEGIILRAVHQGGVQVRTYAADDRSLKEFIVMGPTTALLHVITGVTSGSEVGSRPVLSQVFRALAGPRGEQ